MEFFVERGVAPSPEDWVFDTGPRLPRVAGLEGGRWRRKQENEEFHVLAVSVCVFVYVCACVCSAPKSQREKPRRRKEKKKFLNLIKGSEDCGVQQAPCRKKVLAFWGPEPEQEGFALAVKNF